MGDLEGNSINVGSFVIYSPTGTKGKVTEIIEDEEGRWAVVDKTGLLYKIEVLNLTKEIEETEIGEKKFTKEEIVEALEKEKEAAPTAMDDTSLESGG